MNSWKICEAPVELKYSATSGVCLNYCSKACLLLGIEKELATNPLQAGNYPIRSRSIISHETHL